MLRMGKRIAKWKKTKATKLDKNTEKGFEDVRDGKSSIQWLNTGNHLSLSNDNMTFLWKKKREAELPAEKNKTRKRGPH